MLPPTGLAVQSVRLTLEEAFFLAHVLGCLTVHQAVELQGGAGAATPLDEQVGA